MLGLDRYGFQKKRAGTSYAKTCVFAPGGINGSRSALLYVWGMKHRRTIFLARVGLVRFP
jgi:hypothetical protein